MAYELIYHHPTALGHLDASTVVKLGRGLDSWGAVDAFGDRCAGAQRNEVYAFSKEGGRSTVPLFALDQPVLDKEKLKRDVVAHLKACGHPEGEECGCED